MSVFVYADGYVRIKIWGGSAERFMVLCSHKKMLLWNIEAQGKYVFANMRLKDFYECKKIARKAGVRAVVVERHGLPFLMSKIWKRSFFVLSFLLILVIWLVSTNLLLHIRIEGNYSISENVMKDFLEEQGIYIGMWKKNIELEELEKEIRKKFDLVTWTSGRLDGTVLTINIKENEKVFEEELIKYETYGTSIYATADGIVDYIYVQYGVPMVKKGEEVKAGDLLVDGKVPVYREDQTIDHYQYYEAKAEIGIETLVTVEYSLESVYLGKNYTGRTNQGKFFFVGKKIYRNIGKDQKFVYKDLSLIKEKEFILGEKKAGYGSFICREYVNVEKEYTKEEAKQLLEEEFLKNNTILIEKGIQILEKNVTIKMIMKNWVLMGSMKVIMPAYESRANEISEEIDDSTGI